MRIHYQLESFHHLLERRTVGRVFAVMGKAHYSMGVYDEISPELIGIPLNWMKFPTFQQEPKIMQRYPGMPGFGEGSLQPISAIDTSFCVQKKWKRRFRLLYPASRLRLLPKAEQPHPNSQRF